MEASLRCLVGTLSVTVSIREEHNLTAKKTLLWNSASTGVLSVLKH
jgi:hypothetical protein